MGFSNLIPNLSEHLKAVQIFSSNAIQLQQVLFFIFLLPGHLLTIHQSFNKIQVYKVKYTVMVALLHFQIQSSTTKWLLRVQLFTSTTIPLLLLIKYKWIMEKQEEKVEQLWLMVLESPVLPSQIAFLRSLTLKQKLMVALWKSIIPAWLLRHLIVNGMTCMPFRMVVSWMERI